SSSAASDVYKRQEWGMRRELMSQSYTTKVEQLWQVR
ncbi:DUF4113 domain-containing protein, partial [Pseudomonas aeruginosa]|nr:DUF4113 domain-containing protein [Pseudomonas aeruginosa]